MAKPKKVVPVSVVESEVQALTVAQEVEQEVVAESVGTSELGSLVQQVVQAPVVEAKVSATEKNSGVGIFIRKLINEGMSNKDILKVVHEQYGNTQTTYACVAWYRNKMKKAVIETKDKVGLDFVKQFAMAGGDMSEEVKAEIVKLLAPTETSEAV